MVKTLYIQPAGEAIKAFNIDSVDDNYEDKPEADRQIAGIKNNQPVEGSIKVLKSLIGWWVKDDPPNKADKFVRVQAPGNPQILRLGFDGVSVEEPYGPDGGRLLRVKADGDPMAGFNIRSRL